MPTFKLKNLSVTLGDVAKVDPALTPQICLFPTNYCIRPTIHCRFPTRYCHWPSYITCFTPTDCGYISPHTCRLISDDGCGLAHSTLPPTTIFETVTPVIKQVEDPAVLDTLKGQLDDALVAIKERGVEIDQQFRPQTREDAERLEKELHAALEEVRRLKDDLR